MTFSVKLLFLISLSLSFAAQTIAHLNLFPDNFDIDSTTDIEDKLHLFSNGKSCPEPIVCKNDCSNINMDTFCYDTCSKQMNSCNSVLVENINETKNDSKVLDSEGVFLYYRKFVYNFLENLKNQDLESDNLDFNINIVISRHQVKRLKIFSEAIDVAQASTLVQETTDILNGMFREIQQSYSDSSEPFIETFSKSLINFLLDSRVQLTLFSILTLAVMSLIMFRQICQFKFSIKTLVLLMILLAFVLSVINNHFLLIQRKQIFKQQVLKEKIPDECFLSSIIENKQEKSEKSFLSETLTHFKSYFKDKPTSQKCLDYHEALLVDAKQANFIETIMFTISESFRPLSTIFGESINQFYSSLTKNLSFYQYIPLMIFVTSILVPIIVFMMSFLSLLLFDYEFNFFHLITFRKNKQNVSVIENTNNNQAIQQTEMLKLIDMLKKENSQLIATKSLTNSIETLVETLSSRPLNQQPLAIEAKKPNNKKKEEEEEPIDLNESLTNGVESLIKNKNKREKELLKIIDDLQKQNELINSSRINHKETVKDRSMILDSTSDEMENNNIHNSNKENKIDIKKDKFNSISTPTLVQVGLSKTIKNNSPQRNQVSTISTLEYEDKLTDSYFADDDEDILVILDGK